MLFTEIVIALILAAIIGIVFHFLRQPPMIGFIVAGLIISSLGYFAKESVESINSLASIGVALLLFIVGLEMNLKELKKIGIHTLIVGIGQIIFSFALGMGLTYLLGFTLVTSLYISIALTFSSTILVVKILSEKKDLRSLYGRIILGVLLVQDVVAIVILLFLSGMTTGQNLTANMTQTLIRGTIFIAAIIFSSRYINRFMDFMAKSRELLFLFSVAWALGVSALAGSKLVGLSIEVGGFLAGLSLASSSENFQISAKLRPLRDFFIILFFVGLGTNMLVGLTSSIVIPAIALSIFIIVVEPLVVMAIMALLGYRARTSFLAGVAIAQVSEFSFIIVALGERLGHISSYEVSLVTLVGITTMFLSAYMMYYSDALYEFLKPFLHLFQKNHGMVEEVSEETKLTDHIILVGVHRMGRTILSALSNSTRDFVAVDFDPDIVKTLRDHSLPVFYGDITEEAIQEFISLDKASVVVSTIPDMKDSLSLLSSVLKKGGRARVILTAESEKEAEELYKEGADYVILPHFLGGKELVDILSKDHSFSSLKKLKERDIGFFGNGLQDSLY
jgi:Kef-type K+ transport system membrane component KefB